MRIVLSDRSDEVQYRRTLVAEEVGDDRVVMRKGKNQRFSCR
jgi:hypothetical protein